MKKETKLSGKKIGGIIIILILISFISSIPFVFFNQLYTQHDYAFHISRLESYFESVKQLEFFPKIFYELGNGGGYAVDLFYPSILLLPYTLFRLIGLSTGTSLALFYFLLNFFIAGSSFLLGFNIFKKIKPSILVSLIYTLSTYRFHDEIIRGALGEVFGFAFLPLAFLGLYSILFTDTKQWYYLPIGMSLLITSHVLSAYMMFLFILPFILYKYLIKQSLNEFLGRLKIIFVSGMWTFFIVAWQLLPILEQSLRFKYNYSNTVLSTSVDSLPTVLKVSFFSNIGGKPEITNNIGTFLIIMVFIAWGMFFKLDRYAKTGLVFSTILLIMTTNLFPWRFFQNTPVKMIQFPYRLLLFCTLFLAILVAYIFVKNFQSKNAIFLILTTCIIGLALNLNYSYNPNFVTINNITDVAKEPNSFGGGQEYVKQGHNYNTVVPKNSLDVEIDGNQKITNFKIKRVKNRLEISGDAQSPTIIKTPFLYYYGYEVINQRGEKLKTLEQDGRVAFEIPKGQNKIIVEYKSTLVQKVSMVVSIFAIIGFVIVVMNSSLKNKKDKVDNFIYN
ncbi:glycosyltransferase family protein [Carnobacterium maltaromaticum]|uniref:hypothetical protein n=1 Tax=Carnobacterium maltaromaticum TaxID=2751 RepID=UPI001071FD71|nr:hypothetical protein [Carnobacterium maltaromaticum]TFJ71775.1 hypothetical protein CKN94_11290 [Carnobacterium maltaromaticum]TFJ76688.1 hypothetical protein CKN97_11280 [Carnobacterium maltaromaticum]